MSSGPVPTEFAFFLAFAAGPVVTRVLPGLLVSAFFRGAETELSVIGLRRSNWSLGPSPGRGGVGRPDFGQEA